MVQLLCPAVTPTLVFNNFNIASMFSDRKSRSPVTKNLKLSPSPRTHVRTNTSPRISPSFPRTAQPSASPHKQPPNITSLLQEVCCPNCRYLFRVLKEQHSKDYCAPPLTTTLGTQTPTIFTQDISTITKQIQNIMLSPRRELVIPKLSRLSETKPSSPTKSHKQSINTTITQISPMKTSESDLKTKDVSNMYMRFHQKDVILGQVDNWIKRQHVVVPAYLKGLLDT